MKNYILQTIAVLFLIIPAACKSSQTSPYDGFDSSQIKSGGGEDCHLSASQLRANVEIISQLVIEEKMYRDYIYRENAKRSKSKKELIPLSARKLQPIIEDKSQEPLMKLLVAEVEKFTPVIVGRGQLSPKSSGSGKDPVLEIVVFHSSDVYYAESILKHLKSKIRANYATKVTDLSKVPFGKNCRTVGSIFPKYKFEMWLRK